jgi:cellulose synthase/poly-beta-1,6-N-acetylglucosamine synthase-like glycosyltransferase
MSFVAWTLFAVPILLGCYAYVGYPLCLRALAGLRRAAPRAVPPTEWPSVSITLPAYNEAEQIRASLDSLLAIDYPADRCQILIVSDASSDGTDEIVAEYASRGVELLILPTRAGKGMAERAAAPYLRGDIVINTDASIRIEPSSVKRLVEEFSDPTVGLASGRDLSVSAREEDATHGESGYVGYEMGVRALETRLGGIVGASGCFYAIRAHLHRVPLPDHLSRDFASAMIAREHGYRAVSVDAATCLVPRSTSLDREYRRKVRTMTRGMETLLYKRHLLDPRRHGLFAWGLISHKLCRWLVPWTAPLALLGLSLLATHSAWARIALALVAAGTLWAAAGWVLDRRGWVLPRILTVPAFILAGNVAAVHAGVRAIQGDQNSVWEPTRRRALTT